MYRQLDINVGDATVPHCEKGGWALPGGGHTLRFFQAQEACEALDKILRGSRPIPKPEPKSQPAIVIRRKVSGPDAERWPVSVW